MGCTASRLAASGIDSAAQLRATIRLIGSRKLWRTVTATSTQAPPATRRLAAIVFADMVGYTALASEDEPRALRALAVFREALTEVTSGHEGRVLKTMGDGALIEFPSALAATRFALEIQARLDAGRVEAPDADLPYLRIGIHIGDVVFEAGDVLGDAVNVASRIEPLARPGGICVSGQVRQLVKQQLDLPFERLRRVRMQGVSREIQVYRLRRQPAETAAPGAGAAARLRASLPAAGAVLLVLIGLVGLSRLGPDSLDGVQVLPMHGSGQPEPAAMASTMPTVLPDAGPVVAVAVMPFANLDADPAEDYFGDQLAEELILGLGRVEGLRVPARNSSFAYRGSGVDSRELGRILSVQYLVEGSVRRVGESRRVVVRLIDTADGFPVPGWDWSFRVEGEDLLALQSEIAAKVATRLELSFTGQSSGTIPAAGTADVAAYEAFLLGRYHLNRRSRVGLHKAVEHLERATTLDPGFGRAFASLATAHVLQGCCGNSFQPSASAGELASLAAHRALDLDGGKAEAYAVLGIIDWQLERNASAAAANFRKAIAKDPLSVPAHHWYALLQSQQGRHFESRSKITTALDLDPLSPVLHRAADVIYAAAGAPERAAWHRARALELTGFTPTGSSQAAKQDYF